jgi:hypothetical protein
MCDRHEFYGERADTPERGIFDGCDRHHTQTPACSSPANRSPDKASALIGELRLVWSAVQRRQSVTDELV